jgi:hypothetical protein
MKSKTYFRLFLFILVTAISLALFAYSHKTIPGNQGNPDCSGKCEPNKTQTEFILWESLSRNLFSFRN